MRYSSLAPVCLLTLACGSDGAPYEQPSPRSPGGAGNAGSFGGASLGGSESPRAGSPGLGGNSLPSSGGTPGASASASGGSAGGLGSGGSAVGGADLASSGETSAAGRGYGGRVGLSGSGGRAGGRTSGAGGRADVRGDEGDAGSGSASSAGCEFNGHVTYVLNKPETWPADLVPLVTQAMDEATRYYNCYADLTKRITVNYKPGLSTAEANVDGLLSFGSDKGYMKVATAMHEVGHTLGVGYFPWTELTNNGRWVGANVAAFMKALPASERDPDEESQHDYITADDHHFWPYGLNYAEEHQSEWSLINHVRIVALMQLDKQAYRNGQR